jgi:hypothetical protein
MTKKEKYAIAKEFENIASDIRAGIFYNCLAKDAETHLVRLDRVKELLPKLRDIVTASAFEKVR